MMESSDTSMYLQTAMSTMDSQDGSVPESIPTDIPDQDGTEISRIPLSENEVTFSHKTDSDIKPEQDTLGNEIGGEEGMDTPIKDETPVPLPIEGENYEPDENVQTDIKSEGEEEKKPDIVDKFLERATPLFEKIKNNEITITTASNRLRKPYSYVYSRYQEYCGKTPSKSYTRMRMTGKKRKKKRMIVLKSKPKNTGEIFQCDLCPAFYYRIGMLKTHSKVHLEHTESHECTACGIVFSKLNKLMFHRVTFHEEALQCPHCDSQFVNVASYNSHILTHTGGKPYKCDECDKGFPKKYLLDNHKRVHTGERPFLCGFCGKSFMTLNGVKIHKFIHTGGQDKAHECEHCGKRYQFQSALMEHMNIHTGEKPYVCDYCDQRFNFKQNLMRHKMIHTGEQPYKCELCPATFYLPTDLQRHQISHTGLKPYKCDQCDYACTRKSNLVFHRNTHTGETPYKCDYYGCNAEYANPKSLKKHKLKHGPPPPQICKVCHEKFADLISLKRHMMIHTGEKPFTCDQCFKVCVDQSSLKRHMFKHMYRPLAQKTKQVRQSKKNPNPSPVVKRPSISPIDHKNWPSEYQVPAIVENGHNSLNYSTLGHGSIGHNLVSQSSVGQSSGHSSLGHNPVSHNPISHNPISHNSISHNSISHNSISHNAVSQNHVGLNPVSHSSVSHNSVSHNSVVQSSVGQSSVSPHTWNINPEYTNLVSNAWPSAMDPDELRRRLLNSFK